MEVLLDQGFIISAMRKRIDFITILEKKGFKIIAVKEIMQELKNQQKNIKESQEERAMITFLLETLKRKNVKEMSVGKGRIDHWLINKGKEGYYIATTNSGIKHAVPFTIEIVESRGTVEALRKEKKDS